MALKRVISRYIAGAIVQILRANRAYSRVAKRSQAHSRGYWVAFFVGLAASAGKLAGLFVGQQFKILRPPKWAKLSGLRVGYKPAKLRRPKPVKYRVARLKR